MRELCSAWVIELRSDPLPVQCVVSAVMNLLSRIITARRLTVRMDVLDSSWDKACHFDGRESRYGQYFVLWRGFGLFVFVICQNRKFYGYRIFLCPRNISHSRTLLF
jgi:hypothetical protein